MVRDRCYSFAVVQWTLAHLPGLIVVMPAFKSDAKGLIIAALQYHSPMVILEHRALVTITCNVPVAFEAVPFSKANRTRTGSHITIVGTSLMAYEAFQPAEEIARHGVEADVIDLRMIRPLHEEETIINSIKTDHLVVADTKWELCGVSHPLNDAVDSAEP